MSKGILKDVQSSSSTSHKPLLSARALSALSSDSEEDVVKIYTFFSGLGLPATRIENLKTESKEKAALAEQKESQRASAMSIVDDAEDKFVNSAAEIHKKIKQKTSAFNKFNHPSIIDRRKR